MIDDWAAPVTLENLMLVWNPARTPRAGEVLAVAHPDRDGRGRGYSRSELACSAGWRQMSLDEKRQELFRVVGSMVLQSGVPVANILAALEVVPECRDGMSIHFPDKSKSHEAMGQNGGKNG